MLRPTEIVCNLLSPNIGRSLPAARQWTISLATSGLAHTAIPAMALVILSVTSASLLSPPSGENTIEIQAVMASDASAPSADEEFATEATAFTFAETAVVDPLAVVALPAAAVTEKTSGKPSEGPQPQELTDNGSNTGM